MLYFMSMNLFPLNSVAMDDIIVFLRFALKIYVVASLDFPFAS